MGNDVFANGRELSCKAGSGKSICAFPDVCFTPPQTPATPPGVPIPYPNTGMSSDTSRGSRDVKITKKEVMLKNKSMFKKSVGDQAGCAPKKGVVTSQTGGKVYFNSWSMDVKIEGENAVRHLDLTTHNHGSVPGNTPTWPFIDSMASGAFKDGDPCKEDIIKEQEACADYQPYGDKDVCAAVIYNGDGRKMTQDQAKGLMADASSDTALSAKSDTYHFKHDGSATDTSSPPPDASSAGNCLTARTCQLVPYEPEPGTAGCCRSQTPHHLVEAASFFTKKRGKAKGEQSQLLSVGYKDEENQYRTDDAPSICAFGPNPWRGSHGQLHTIQGHLNKMDRSEAREPMPMVQKEGQPKKFSNQHTIPYGTARDNGILAAQEVNPKANCDPECQKAQLDAYHKDKLGVEDDTKIKSYATGRIKDENYNQVIADLTSDDGDIG